MPMIDGKPYCKECDCLLDLETNWKDYHKNNSIYLCTPCHKIKYKAYMEKYSPKHKENRGSFRQHRRDLTKRFTNDILFLLEYLNEFCEIYQVTPLQLINGIETWRDKVKENRATSINELHAVIGITKPE